MAVEGYRVTYSLGKRIWVGLGGLMVEAGKRAPDDGHPWSMAARRRGV